MVSGYQRGQSDRLVGATQLSEGLDGEGSPPRSPALTVSLVHPRGGLLPSV